MLFQRSHSVSEYDISQTAFRILQFPELNSVGPSCRFVPMHRSKTLFARSGNSLMSSLRGVSRGVFELRTSGTSVFRASSHPSLSRMARAHSL